MNRKYEICGKDKNSSSNSSFHGQIYIELKNGRSEHAVLPILVTRQRDQIFHLGFTHCNDSQCWG